MSPEVQTLIKRLEKLERQNQRLRRAACAALAVVTAFVMIGQAPASRTVSGNRFVLLDAQGRTRAELGLKDGSPGLVLLDANEKVQAALVVSPSGPGLGLFDASGHGRAALTLTAEGPILSLRDANDKPQVSLAVTADGPGLDLQDAEGFSTSVGVAETLSPTTGEKRKTSAASVVLFDSKGTVVWRAPS